MLQSKSLLFGVVFLFTQQLLAQYPDDLRGDGLKAWIKMYWYDEQFSDLGYDAAREAMYSDVDEVEGMIHCIYTDFEQAASVTTYPNPISAEHIIPQSFFGGESPMRSDLHNLRPAHGSVNSARSNHPYAEVDDAAASWYGIDAGGSYVSTETQPSSDENYSERAGSLWEPQEDRKGDLARSVFYFFTVYHHQAGDISVLGDLNMLRDWHLTDPTDALEIERNNRVEAAQGNRNPYVDYPDLVDHVWFWTDADGCTYPSAMNYDSTANRDDLSCLFEAPCPADFNGDGLVQIADLLTLLAFFGLSCED